MLVARDHTPAQSRSRHAALTGRESFAAAARCEAEAGLANSSRCVLIILCRWHSQWRKVLAARDHTPAEVVCLCNGAAMQRRLVEQALRLLHGARRRPDSTRCVLIILCRWHSRWRRVLATRDHALAPAGGVPLQRSRHTAPTGRASFAAAARCMLTCTSSPAT